MNDPVAAEIHIDDQLLIFFKRLQINSMIKRYDSNDDTVVTIIPDQAVRRKTKGRILIINSSDQTIKRLENSTTF